MSGEHAGHAGDERGESLQCRCGAVWTRVELAKIMGVRVESLDAVTSIQRCSRCSGISVEAGPASASPYRDRRPPRAPTSTTAVRMPRRRPPDDLAHDGFVTVATFFAMNFASNARDNPQGSFLDAILRPNPKLIRKIMAGDRGVTRVVKKQVRQDQKARGGKGKSSE